MNTPDQIQPAFDAAMESLFPDSPPVRLGLGLSGGGDSMSLLLLLVNWARQNGTIVEALSVDHGFRPEAKDEIALAARQCAALGVAHQSNDWRWDGGGNLQDAARQARRAAFSEWQQTAKLDAVALGHTADDQAETVLLRLARGSGVDGLAAMEPRSTQPNLILIRPLLGLRRADLRAYLSAKGASWADDPSNDDPRFDRVRARQLLSALAPLGLTVDRLTRTAQQMQSARTVLRRAARHQAVETVAMDRGDLMLDLAALEATEFETAHRVLAAALSFVSGQQYRPRFDRLAQTLASRKTATLHGCLLTFDAERLRVSREPAAVAGLACAPDQVWDGRWRLIGPAQDGMEIRALSEAGLHQCTEWRNAGLPRQSLAASPSIWLEDRLVAAPLAGLENGWSAELLPEKANFAAYLPL